MLHKDFICILMRTGFFFLSLFAGTLALGQTRVLTYYDSSHTIKKEEYYILNADSAMVDGPYLMFSPSGNPILRGNYEQGKREGLFLHFYEDGTIQRKTTYVNGLKEGLTQVYSPSGTLIQEATFDHDTIIGALKLYDENGNLKGETEFANGKPDGWVIAYWPGGGKAEETYYRDGKPNGPMRQYYENGNLKLEAEYKNGLLDGEYKTFYPSGKLEMEALNLRGRRSGYIKYYYENGQLKSDGTYKDGALSGPFTSYYADGAVHMDFKYADGKKSGSNIEYFPDGTVKVKSTYSNHGMNATILEYNERGDLVAEKALNNELPHGVWTFYDKKGRVSLVENYQAGKLHGKKLIYEGDKLLEEETYTFGNRAGESKEYYPNGTLMTLSTWKLNWLHGPYIRYHKDGSKAYEGEYARNKRTGTWTYYDKKGQPELEEIYEAGLIVETRELNGEE